jgi:hypothetical protein
MTIEEKLELLIQAGMFGLGALVAREGLESPVVQVLAGALREVGVESEYLDAIERASEQNKKGR